ncbi:TetR/AcrR family transcriptional regulator [uncultured Sphingomonas sp.]|uniref:TetR/AcrR family transcriptional regulator n=1 Tax=uncultured Sphingomonas sp. TaxID=158754 RepID=UPI0035CB1757
MSTSRTYHHGSLREALIQAALAQIEAGEPLSLREAARRAGVSATAVYRHFPDKQALLGAVARAGLAQLGAAQHAAYDAAGGGAAGFNATGIAYVRFALAHPALFRLIFGQPVGDVLAAGSGDDAMTFLLANAAALAPPGVEARVFALQAWSIAHGLAMLMLDGAVPVDEAVIARVVDAHAMLGAVSRRPRH